MLYTRWMIKYTMNDVMQKKKKKKKKKKSTTKTTDVQTSVSVIFSTFHFIQSSTYIFVLQYNFLVNPPNFIFTNFSLSPPFCFFLFLVDVLYLIYFHQISEIVYFIIHRVYNIIITLKYQL